MVFVSLFLAKVLKLSAFPKPFLCCEASAAIETCQKKVSLPFFLFQPVDCFKEHLVILSLTGCFVNPNSCTVDIRNVSGYLKKKFWLVSEL